MVRPLKRDCSLKRGKARVAGWGTRTVSWVGSVQLWQIDPAHESLVTAGEGSINRSSADR